MPSHCSAHPSVERYRSESTGNGQGCLVAIPRDESIGVQLFQNRDVQYVGCSALHSGGMSRADLSGISQRQLPLNVFSFEGPSTKRCLKNRLRPSAYSLEGPGLRRQRLRTALIVSN